MLLFEFETDDQNHGTVKNLTFICHLDNLL